MGFFSWVTADTGESIPNLYTGLPMRPVYLLQPGGRPPIKESAYEGYGVFGECNAHTWLAQHNIPSDLLKTADEETLRLIGISLEAGVFHEDERANKWICAHHVFAGMEDAFPRLAGIREFTRYDQPLKACGGRTPNQLIGDGTWQTKPIMDELAYPLKFSYDPEADYDSLPPSKPCERQGYFYDQSEYDALLAGATRKHGASPRRTRRPGQ